MEPTNDIKGLIRQSPPVDVSKPYDATTLKGKTIVITGGANGLGSYMVREWASHGANIIIGDVADAAGEKLVAELTTQYPDSAFAFQHCDVTDWESQVGLFETAVHVSPHGGIDIVVPNAGIILPDVSIQFEEPALKNGRLPKPNLRSNGWCRSGSRASGWTGPSPSCCANAVTWRTSRTSPPRSPWSGC